MDASDVAGLTTEAARQRLTELGPNEIAREKGRGPWRLLAAQFASPLVWLLLGAALVSGFLRDLVDAIAIAAILIINALVGFFQEHRAERAHVGAAIDDRPARARRARRSRGGGAGGGGRSRRRAGPRSR